MMEESNENFDYQVSLRIEDIRLLHHCVQRRIEKWEGYPARPVDEQEHLWYLRDNLNRMIFDYAYREL